MTTTDLDLAPLLSALRALSDETRLRIVALLSHGELCVCSIHEALELPQPKVSRHLATLRAAGLVETRREGAWVHYRLAQPEDPASLSQLRALLRSLRGSPLGAEAATLAKRARSRSCR